MSSLRQPTHIEQDYKALVEICKTDCQITYRKSAMDTVQLRQMDTVQETERVRQMIGTEDEFSAKMSSDPMYQPALILRRRQRALILRRRQRVRRKLTL
jgi:hypothetical protein